MTTEDTTLIDLSPQDAVKQLRPILSWIFCHYFINFRQATNLPENQKRDLGVVRREVCSKYGFIEETPWDGINTLCKAFNLPYRIDNVEFHTSIYHPMKVTFDIVKL